MIGIFELNIARATFSSLKGHKSSIEPPPLPIIKTSKSYWFACLIFFSISLLEASPCTKLGNKVIFAIGYLLFNVEIISFIAAPVLAVTTPILVGYLGISFLYFLSNKPSLANFSFNYSKALYKLPIPSSIISST